MSSDLILLYLTFVNNTKKPQLMKWEVYTEAGQWVYW